jgi:hypothetical protein
MDSVLLAITVALGISVQNVPSTWPADPWAGYHFYAAPQDTSAKPSRSKRKSATPRHRIAAVKTKAARLNPTGMLNATGMERSAAECRAKWSTVDPHGYGILFGPDLAAARPIVPITLSDRDYVTIEDYLSTCGDIVAANQRG